MSDELMELPEGWELTTIGEVTLPYETIQPTKEAEKEFQYIDIGSIDNSTQTITNPKSFLGKDAPSRARRVVKTDDVLFSTVRTYLKNIARVPIGLDGVLTSTGIAVLRSSSSIDSDFLFHWVLSEQFIQKMSSSMDGTLYPAVTDKDVSIASIPLPPLNEQKRIVAAIEALRERSQKARSALSAIPELCDKFRQSILTAAFRGDLTADWREQNPDVESASVLLERIRRGQVSSRDTDISQLTTLPETWEWTTIGEIAKTITKGSSPKWQGFEYCESGIPFVRSQNVGWGFLDASDVAYLPESFNQHEPRSIIQAGDVLLNIVGASIGRAAMATESVIGGNLNQAVAIIRILEVEILKELVVFYLISPFTQRRIHLEKVDVARANFSLSDIKSLPFPLIPVPEQRAIANKIGNAFTQIEKLARQATVGESSLSNLDRSVLAKAFRGELIEQDPNDEPASVLLERIRVDREQQAQEKTKKPGTKRKRTVKADSA